MHRMFLVPLTLLLTLTTAHAATLHVSTSGSDSNPCTAAAPCRTLQHGASRLSGGDTLVVHAGTYAEGNLRLPSGSSGSPTTLTSAPGERAILQPGSTSVDCIICLQSGASWITIDGLVLDGGSPSGERLTAFPIYDQRQHDADSVDHITVRNSEIRNGRHSCFLVAGQHWVVEHNEIHHCGTDSALDHGMYFSAHDSTLTNNFMHDNTCYNIQNYSSVGLFVGKNTHTGNRYTNSGCGVTVEYNHGETFTNNVIWSDATQGKTPALLCCGTNATVANNTIVGNQSTGLEVAHTGTDAGAQVRGNIVCDNRGTNIRVQQAIVSNNLTTCPDFVNASAGDFRLTDGRTDVGATLSPGTGTAQMQPPAVSPVPAPRNLRAITKP